MAERPLKPWYTFGGRRGDRTVDQQMQGLLYLQQSVRDKTVLDLGCAEGLVTVELAKAGALALHGIEIRPAAVADANSLRGDFPITFEQADLNTWRPKRSYDVSVMLAILHKLRDPLAFLKDVAKNTDELIAIRLPPRADNPVVNDVRSGGKRIDLQPALFGFKLVHWTPGYLNEWVGYYRRERNV